MDELGEVRKAVEALTARVVILEGIIASSMQEVEYQEVDPVEAFHRQKLAALRDS